MKRIILLYAFVQMIQLNVKAQMVSDSVFMGPSYRNEVYYSLQKGMVDTVEIKTWDLAFSTVGSFDQQFFTIQANHSNGVRVYKYPKSDITGWAAFDTTGWQGWRNLWNTDTSWSHGAFNLNPENHPVYSWGTYTNSGEITGDSLYLIGYASSTNPVPTTFKKLWIVQRKSSSGVRTWEFRYANLNGTADTTITLNDAQYANKYFAYYNLKTNTALNREPVNTSWDIVFTRYFGAQNSPTTPYYQVTGVLQNRKVQVIKETSTAVDNMVNPLRDDSRFAASNMSTIGWNWKALDANFAYYMEDSTAFFIKVDSAVANGNVNTKIYKLVFTGFAGSSTGKVAFGKKLISNFTTSVNELATKNINITAFPNPVSQTLTVLFDTENSNEATVSLNDVTGKNVMLKTITAKGFSKYELDVTSLTKGVYILNVNTENARGVQKIIVD
ncbi:MAG: T9SS type A sorting domain-containing protein [Bacteroidota bacterium]